MIAQAERELRSYYDFTGRADHMVDGLLTDTGAIADAVAGYREIGADEVMLYCWSTDVGQVDRLSVLL